jgi:hypothetical protein
VQRVPCEMRAGGAAVRATPPNDAANEATPPTRTTPRYRTHHESQQDPRRYSTADPPQWASRAGDCCEPSRLEQNHAEQMGRRTARAPTYCNRPRHTTFHRMGAELQSRQAPQGPLWAPSGAADGLPVAGNVPARAAVCRPRRVNKSMVR